MNMAPTNRAVAESYRVPPASDVAPAPGLERIVPVDDDDAAGEDSRPGCGCGGEPDAQDDGLIAADPPLPRHSPEGVAVLIDWATRKIVNGANRARNFAYKILSYRYAHRIGVVNSAVFHLRRLHCDVCEHRVESDVTRLTLKRGDACAECGRGGRLRFDRRIIGRADYCDADDCKCGKTRRATLDRKVGLAGWHCPVGNFGEADMVSRPTLKKMEG